MWLVGFFIPSWLAESLYYLLHSRRLPLLFLYIPFPSISCTYWTYACLSLYVYVDMHVTMDLTGNIWICVYLHTHRARDLCTVCAECEITNGPSSSTPKHVFCILFLVKWRYDVKLIFHLPQTHWLLPFSLYFSFSLCLRLLLLRRHLSFITFYFSFKLLF